MKPNEIVKMSLEDLKSKLAEEQESLNKLRFAHALSPIENPMRIRDSRRLIARLYTAISQKESAK
jgi:large subunit ribosomal protein L29